jgi:hypothetical protein
MRDGRKAASSAKEREREKWEERSAAPMSSGLSVQTEKRREEEKRRETRNKEEKRGGVLSHACMHPPATPSSLFLKTLDLLRAPYSSFIFVSVEWVW